MAKSNLIDVSWEGKRTPFVGAPTSRDSGFKDQRYLNVFIDRIENTDTGQARWFLVKRPGLSQHSQPSGTTGVGRGIAEWNGNTYAVIGNRIYKNNTLLSVTMNTSTGMVSFSETSAISSTRYLGVCDGTAIYYIAASDAVTTIQSGQVQTITVTAGGSGYTSAPTVSITGGGGSGATATANINAGAVVSVTITNRGSGYTSLPTIGFSGGGGTGATATADLTGLPATLLPQLEFLNGYMIVATQDGRIYNSGLEDPLTWQDSDFIQAQSFPDELVAITRQNDTIMALGTSSIEFFVDVAGISPGSFLGRLEQGTMQIGCAARNSVVQPENKVFWVANSNTGGYTVQQLDGITNLKKISTEVVERFLNLEEADISDCYAFPLRTAGHFFYVLTLPSINRTFVYDIEEERWTEWGSGLAGRFAYVASCQHSGYPLLQHETDGKLYKVSPSVYQDGTGPILVLLQTALVDFDTMNRKFYRSFELYGDLSDTPSEFSIYYSDDNYRTWSLPRTVTNDYRMIIRQLGQSRRRAWKVEHTDNLPLRLEGFEVMYQEGSF